VRTWIFEASHQVDSVLSADGWRPERQLKYTPQTSQRRHPEQSRFAGGAKDLPAKSHRGTQTAVHARGESSACRRKRGL